MTDESKIPESTIFKNDVYKAFLSDSGNYSLANFSYVTGECLLITYPEYKDPCIYVHKEYIDNFIKLLQEYREIMYREDPEEEE